MNFNQKGGDDLTQYVELEKVEELLQLIKARDAFHDWSTSYEEYEQKIKLAVEQLKSQAIQL